MITPEQSAELRERTKKARAIYETQLKALLEPQYDGQGVAIHPASGDYLVAMSPTHAGHAMRKRHPEGGVVTMRIGPSPDFALTARILAGERMTAKSLATSENQASKENL